MDKVGMTRSEWDAFQGAQLERIAVERVLRRGKLTEGPEVPLLESDFADWLVGRGAPRVIRSEARVVAVSSGTAALTALLMSQGVGPGNEVIVPAFTFTATALAVCRAGATPVFADVNATWGLDSRSAARMVTARTAAILAVDLHGCPANYEALKEVAANEGLLLVEDACPAYGSTHRYGVCGTFTNGGAAFSLNQSKALSAGEGGLVVAPSGKVAARIRCLRRFGEPTLTPPDGFRRSAWTGDNWKLPELSAAMARASLQTLDQRVFQGRVNGNLIREAVTESAPHLRVHGIPPDSDPAWHKIRVTAYDPEGAQYYAQKLEAAGVPIRQGEVAPLDQHPAFSGIRADEAPNAHRAACTFVIGSRERPVFSWAPGDAARYAQLVRSLPN